jgi:hypothetical protein
MQCGKSWQQTGSLISEKFHFTILTIDSEISAINGKNSAMGFFSDHSSWMHPGSRAVGTECGGPVLHFLYIRGLRNPEG